MGILVAAGIALGALLLAAPTEEVEEPKVCKIGIGNRVLYPPGVLQGSEYVQSHIQGKNKNNEDIQVTGYVKKTDFDALNVSTVDIPQNFAGLEAVCVPTRLENQFFRIYEVFEDEDCVTIKARHVWYDNLQNYTLWQPTEGTEYTGAAACRNILTNALSSTASLVASDCTDTRTFKPTDFERKNLVEAYLDPENGVCAKYGLSLIRDNWDFYCLKEVGYDRGFVVQNKKNLLGVERTESIENVATRIAPFGKDANGDIVWLDNDGVKYVDSQYLSDYGYPRVEILDTGLQIGKDEVTADNINDKLLAAAEKRFTEDKVDLPELEMKIEFLSLGDTEEYAQYRGLDKVYLYDIITIKDTVRGYEYSAQVVGIEHDILTGMLLSVTLGSIQNSDGIRKIAVWQVPEINGENIRLKTILSGSFAEGAIGAADIADGAVNTIHLASATIDYLKSDTIDAVTANIHEIIAGSITAEDIVAGSITSESIATRTLQAENIAFGVITGDEIHSLTIDTEHLKANSIVSEKIAAGEIKAVNIDSNAITSDKIAAGQITSAKIGAGEIKAINIDTNAIEADKIKAGAINASKIDTTDINAINATLGTAGIVDAHIENADISYAKIKDLTAGTAIFDTSITQQGIADRLYINRLLITYGQMVEATIGDLVIGASDGNYYHVDVAWSSSGVPTLVPTQVTTPSAAEIAAGHTSSGKTIIGDVGTYAELCSSDFYAINSIIDVITAKRINVDELWARQAFINKLMVTDISSNTYIQSTIGNWQSGSTITQTIDGLNSRISSLGYGTVYMQPNEPSHSDLVAGDIWIQTLSDATWQDILDNSTDYPTWQAVYNGVSTWQTLGSIPIMWVWDGQRFQQMYDAMLPTSLETEIQQLATAITLRATKTEVDLLSNELTEFSAELRIQSDEIESAVSTVNAKAASFVMWADPRTAYSVSLGDIWIKRDPGFCNNSTWQSVSEDFATWNALKTAHDTWGDMLGDRTYVWNGSEWVETSDRASEIYQKTLIDQTSRDVTILAETTATLGDEYIMLSGSLQVANDHITAEVRRATQKEGELEGSVSTISQTADDILLGVRPVGAVVTSGSYVRIQNDSITLASGGKIIANANQIQIGSGKTLESALAGKTDVTSSVQQFYLSTSKTVLSGGSWSNTAPEWTSGKYMWMRTAVSHADGTTTYMPGVNGTCIAGATGATGSQGVSGKSIGSTETRYLLGSSYTVAPTEPWSSWSTTLPAYQANKYYWTWTKTYLTDGTEVSPPGVKLSELGVNAAYDQAANAWDVANGLINGSQNAFYAKNISNTGVTVDETTLHVTANGNMYIDSGGALIIRSSASTAQSPQNVVVMNNSGIAIESTGTITCAANKLILSSSGGTTVTLNDQLNSITLQASGNLAPVFLESERYEAGDIVSHSGNLYRFKQAKSAGAWNANAVKQVTVEETHYAVQSGISIIPQGIEISGGTYVKIKSGGSFTVDSGKFSIDTARNVVMQGTVRATAGYINSWTIDGDYIWSGTGANTVALDSSTSRNFAIYAGADYSDQAAWQAAGSPSGKTYDAPFRVKRDGTVYITQLKAINNQGEPEDVNLFTVGLWKLNGCSTIASYSTSGGYVDSMTLCSGEVINFKSAASVKLAASWSGDTLSIKKDTSGADQLAYVIRAEAGISYDSETHKYTASASARANGTERSTDSDESGTEAYDAGWGAVDVTGIERQSGNTFSDSKKTVYFNVRGVAENGAKGEWTQVSADVTTTYNAGYDAGYDVGFADGEAQFAVLNPNFSGGLYDNKGNFIGAGNWYLSYGAAVYGKT